MNLTFSRCARVRTAAFASVFAMVEIIPNFRRGAVVRPFRKVRAPSEPLVCPPEGRAGRRAMNRILGGRCALLAPAWVLGALLAGVSPALAQNGFDILTLRGQGSSIGVEITELDTEKAKSSSVDHGVVVATVRPETPAARAGFQSGDIVVEFDGEAVRSARQFRRLVEETRPGHEVKATVVRDRSRRSLSVTPELVAAGRAPEVLKLPALRQVQPNLKPAVPFRVEPAVP